MNVIVDSNIVFSAILNTESHIGQILTTSTIFSFYTIGLLKTEIIRHKDKIQKITGFSADEFAEVYDLVTSKIQFVDEVLIPDASLQKAYSLTCDIDEDDTLFVALANQMRARLWTGDKILRNGLMLKGYSRIISTSELYNVFITKEWGFKRNNKLC